MKYVIVIPDGAADEPQDSLGGRTPFQAARTPGLDALAARGRVGLTNHVPDSLPPGSEVACMSLMGYDPLAFFTGRAPLEAAAQGITLGPDDWAVRCNLVSIAGQTMEDFTAGHITTAEATELLAACQRGVAADFPDLAASWSFVPGVSYRNLLIHRGATGAAPFMIAVPSSLKTMTSFSPSAGTNSTVVEAAIAGSAASAKAERVRIVFMVICLPEALSGFCNHSTRE
jgi:2,3-bisphosphoglycerate-independent phosphoglycerate mutase